MKNRFGFTLMEVLVVVLIVAVLFSVAMPGYRRVVTLVKNREAVIALRTIGRGIELYNLENGPLPQNRSGDFSMLDITVKNSKNWTYYFYCYDEFKSCGVWANPTRELGVDEHDYYLQLWVHKGVVDPDIVVKEHVLVSQEEDEEGNIIGQTSISSNAGEEICKKAGGKRVEVTDGHVCILQ